MIEHLLHLCYSFTQFSDGNKAATYNSLQKNIIEMNFCYIYCVSTPFILVFIIIFNIFIFNHFDPKLYGIISCLFTMDTTVSIGKYALFPRKALKCPYRYRLYRYLSRPHRYFNVLQFGHFQVYLLKYVFS